MKRSPRPNQGVAQKCAYWIVLFAEHHSICEASTSAQKVRLLSHFVCRAPLPPVKIA